MKHRHELVRSPADAPAGSPPAQPVAPQPAQAPAQAPAQQPAQPGNPPAPGAPAPAPAPGGNPAGPANAPDAPPAQPGANEVSRPAPQPAPLTAQPGNQFDNIPATPQTPQPPAQSAAPEKYALALPEGYALPAHVSVDLSETNPAVQDFTTWAKTVGLSQQQFAEGLQRLVQASTSHIPDPAAEIAKLGEHGQQRVQRTVNWVRGNVSPAAYQALASKGISADYIAAIEELMTLAGEPRFAADGAVPPSVSVTRESVQQMMQDEKYWKAKDPKYIAEVEAAWKQLVGTGTHQSTVRTLGGRGGRAA